MLHNTTNKSKMTKKETKNSLFRKIAEMNGELITRNTFKKLNTIALKLYKIGVRARHIKHKQIHTICAEDLVIVQLRFLEKIKYE